MLLNPHVRAWWESRVDDLGALTLEEFSAKHGVKVGITEHWRLLLVGKTFREPGWYLEDSAREALLSDLPASAVASFLGITEGGVGSLRHKIKEQGYVNPIPGNERIAASKRGIPVHPKTRAALAREAKKSKSPRHRARISAALRERNRTILHGPVNPDHKAWTAEEYAMLGTAPDRQIALMLGRSIPAVRSQRKLRGIKAYRLPWQMPVSRTPLAKQLSELVKRRYESISGAVRATGIDYKVLWTACDGRRGTRDSTLDAILGTLHATREDLV